LLSQQGWFSLFLSAIPKQLKANKPLKIVRDF
jgi:hypothetical protein